MQLFHALCVPLRLLALSLLVLLMNGCGGGVDQPSGSNCATPAGQQLTDIQSVVDWINAMDKPLTLPCFIESLPRPLKTYSALSIFSAQPSVGERSPRIFFFFDALILTVAIDQDLEENIPPELEYHLLEMSWVTEEDALVTVKGEIKFPVVETLPAAAPYSGIEFGANNSICSACHPNESLHEYQDGVPVYRSSLLKPTQTLPIERLTDELHTCDKQLEPHRCAMLQATVAHGPLVFRPFPKEAKTIFDN